MSHPSFLWSAGEGVWETFETGVSGRGPFRIARVQWSFQSRRERWLCDVDTRTRLGFVKAVGGCTNVSWVGTYCGRSITRSFGPTTIQQAQHELRTFIDACPMDPISIGAFDTNLKQSDIAPYDSRGFTSPCHDDLAQALDAMTAEALELLRWLRTPPRRSRSTHSQSKSGNMLLEAARQAEHYRQLLRGVASQPLQHPVPMRLQALALWTIGLVRAAQIFTPPAQTSGASRRELDIELSRLCGGAIVQARMSADWPY